MFLESVFCFENFQNFKNCATLFWRVTLTGQASRETLIASLLKSSRDSLASQSPSCEKDLKKFQNFSVFSIFTTQFGDLFVSGRRYTEIFVAQLATPSRVRLPVVKNT